MASTAAYSQSFLKRENKQQQSQLLLSNSSYSSPSKEDILFDEFQTFRKDAQRKAKNATKSVLLSTTTEQSPVRSAEDKFSIQSLAKAAANSLSLSQQNGFVCQALQKEMRDSSFERQLARSFNTRPKQVLSPRRNQKPSLSSTLSSDKKLPNPARFIEKLSSPKKSQQTSQVDRSFNSFQSSGLQQLLEETRSKIQQNGVSPSRQRASQQQSYFSSSSSTSKISSTSSTAYLIDKGAHDLEDYLMTLSPKDFNSLPKANIEQLIKLSSVIMYKVKNYGFYRQSLF